MAEDHLDNPVSISVDVTPSGVKAGAKSRFVSGVDRLLGGVADLLGAPLEGPARRQRARDDADVAAIEAAGKRRVEMIQTDSTFAERAMEQHLRVAGIKHANKVEAVQAAIEDLRLSPPSPEQNENGGETLDDAFVNRWERYAEDASAEEVRHRWGRVLAGEIRQPGTFSAKVMRVIDEMDPTTAALFERVCKHRIAETLVACLVTDFAFMDRSRLVTAGLILDVGVNGQIRKGTKVTDEDGGEWDFINFGTTAVGFSPDAKIPSHYNKPLSLPLIRSEGTVAIPVYILTDVGHAISSILENTEADTIQRLIEQFQVAEPTLEVRVYERDDAGRFSVKEIRAAVTPTHQPLNLSEQENPA